MDLRKFNPSGEQIEELRKVMHDMDISYQPFVLSDNCCTGTADEWINQSGTYLMDKKDVRPEEWNRFTEANGKMRKMYSDWINSICELSGPLQDLTVVDTAANQGCFLYELLDRGAKRAVAYDVNYPPLYNSYKLLNEITGHAVEFVGEPYDMMTHEIPNAEEADIVISSAIMLHLSDPTYYLAFLGSITKKLLFLFTAIDDNSDYRITYHGYRTHFKNATFPTCFDGSSTVSRPLIEFGLQELGFETVIELPHQQDWLPMSWYRPYKALVAIR